MMCSARSLGCAASSRHLGHVARRAGGCAAACRRWAAYRRAARRPAPDARARSSGSPRPATARAPRTARDWRRTARRRARRRRARRRQLARATAATGSPGRCRRRAMYSLRATHALEVGRAGPPRDRIDRGMLVGGLAACRRPRLRVARDALEQLGRAGLGDERARGRVAARGSARTACAARTPATEAPGAAARAAARSPAPARSRGTAPSRRRTAAPRGRRRGVRSARHQFSSAARNVAPAGVDARRASQLAVCASSHSAARGLGERACSCGSAGPSAALSSSTG